MSYQLMIVRALSAVVLATLCTDTATAQEDSIPQPEAVIRYYHGTPGRSRPITYELDHGILETSKNGFVFTRPPGSRLCIQVVNAHPILYGYSLATAIDSTPVAIPDASALVAALNGLLGPTNATTRPAAGTPATSLTQSATAAQRELSAAIMESLSGRNPLVDGPPREYNTGVAWVDAYLKKLGPLYNDVSRAQSIARESDQPEEFSEIEAAPSEGGGFSSAQAWIRALPSTSGRFNDPSLASEIREWTRIARDSFRNDTTDGGRLQTVLLDALNSSAETLLRVRDALRASYTGVPRSQRLCATVPNRPMFVTLGVHRRDTATAKARDAGKLLRVKVNPIYERPVVELIPVAFSVYARRVPSFSLRDGLIERQEGDEFRFRGGFMMLANLKNFQADQSVTFGTGLGFGFFGEKKALSDFLFGFVISYRDLFRTGIGAGLAELPHTIKRPAQVGGPLPPDVGNIDEAVETKKQGALFIIFNMTGLSLPVVK